RKTRCFPKHLKAFRSTGCGTSSPRLLLCGVMGGTEMGRKTIACMAGAGVALLCSVAVANAAEVKVLTAGALQTAMRSLAQDFERQTGNHVTITPTNPANVEKDMAAGQVDVVGGAVPTLGELDESGR